MYKHILSILFVILIGVQAVISGELTPKVTIVIESLPGNTPKNDTIFICGNFNNWEINDPDYILQRRSDGKLTIMVPFVSDTLQFKFSRGDWMKIETGANNTYLPNRVMFNKNQKTESVVIENWQDLGGRKAISFFVFILSAGVLNGLLLIFILIRNKKKDPQKIKHLVIWILFLVFFFTGTIIYELSDLIQKARLLLLFQLALTIAGPLLLHLCIIMKGVTPTHFIKHYIPLVIISFWIFLRLLNLIPNSIFHSETSLYLPLIDTSITLFASLLFLSYLIFIIIWTSTHSWRVQVLTNCFWQQLFPQIHYVNTSSTSKQIKNITSEPKTFIQILTSINIIVMVIGLLTLLPIIKNINALPDILLNLAFSFTTIQIFWTFYYITYKKTIFTLPKAEQTIELHQQDMDLLEKIRLVMIEEKPYKNPELTLSDFSEILNTKPHTISKIINDCFHFNFRDFINQFRTFEFIEMVNKTDKPSYTYLYLAHEAGFNSKSTFNLAFKKCTGLSPRNYFKKEKP